MLSLTAAQMDVIYILWLPKKDSSWPKTLILGIFFH